MNAVKILIPTAFAAIALMYIVGLFFTPVWEPMLFTGQNLHTRDAGRVVELINSVTLVGDGNYDSWERPRGTPYQVPEGKQLIITHLEGMPEKGAGPEAIEIGYSPTTPVSNTATAAVDYVAVYRYTFEVSYLSDAHHDSWARIPSGAYPTLNIIGDGAISATGVLINE